MRRLLVPAILLVMTIGVYWKLLLTRQYTYLDSPDLAYQVAPWLEVQARAWQHGDFPLLWDPYIAGGQSLIGQAQPATAYPLNWLLFIVPLKKGFLTLDILHWYLALIHFLAAMAGYALCRDLKRSRAASILAAAAFAFAGYVGTTWWPQQIHATVWAPLVLLFSFRAMRGDRPLANSFFAGVSLGIQWLGGHHQVPIFTVLGIAGIWLFHIATGKTPQVKLQRLLFFAVLVLTMVAAGALQLFPSYSYGHQSVRWAGASHELHWNEPVPYSVHDEFSQIPTAFLGVFIDGIFRHANPFVGITVLILAIMGVVLAWDELPVRLLAGMALGGMLLSFAGQTLLHGILYSLVPFVDKARSASVAIFVFHLGVCPLAAFGVDRILEHPRSPWLKPAVIGSATAGFLLWMMAGVLNVTHAQVDFRLAHVGLTALAAVLFAGLLMALKNGTVQPRNVAIWLIVLVMIEIGSLSGMEMTNRDAGWSFWPQLERDRDVAQFLKLQPGPFRIEVKDDDVKYSFGDWYGIETFLGYTASLPERFMPVIGLQRTRELLGVKYYLAKAPANNDQRELMSGANGIKVFEVPNAMPRVWSVHEAVPFPNPDVGSVLNAIDLHRQTIVPAAAPQLQPCDGDRVALSRHKAQATNIEVEMNCRGMVILGDAYSADWAASVDGNSVPIYPAYSFLRGVVVDAGHHHIEFRYRPQSVYWGAALTFATFLGALFVGLRKPKRAERRMTSHFA